MYSHASTHLSLSPSLNYICSCLLSNVTSYSFILSFFLFSSAFKPHIVLSFCEAINFLLTWFVCTFLSFCLFTLLNSYISFFFFQFIFHFVFFLASNNTSVSLLNSFFPSIFISSISIFNLYHFIFFNMYCFCFEFIFTSSLYYFGCPPEC